MDVKGGSTGPAPNGERSQLWRTVSLMSLTALGTGGGQWLLFVRNSVTRDDCREIVRTELAAQPNPYLQDKRSIDDAVIVVGHLRDDLGTMKGQLQEILRRLPEPTMATPWRPSGGREK